MSRAKKRIISNGATIRKVIPVSIVKVKDVYGKKIKNNLKDKYADSLTDKVIFEVMVKCLKDIDEKDFIKHIPKKYIKKNNYINTKVK